MTEFTPLDTAHAAMQDAPEDDAARLRFYGRLADTELLLLLAEEMQGDNASPQIYETSSGSFVLAFDREDRLTDFTGAPAPYLALSGRSLAGMLAGQGVGLGLNLNGAPSETLIPAGGLEWLADTLDQSQEEVDGDVAALMPPTGLPESLLVALDAKLAASGGLAACAYLAATRGRAGGTGHILAFVDALEQAQPALTQAVAEALTFSGIDAGTLDVGFFQGSDPVAARLASVGLRFDLPQPEPVRPRAAPGSDPDKPPRLK